MSIRVSVFACVFALVAAAALFAGCSFEPGDRTQMAGQECFVDGECAEGLVCVERRCRPEGAITPTDPADAGPDVTDDDTDPPPPDAPDPDPDTMPPPPCDGHPDPCNSSECQHLCPDTGTVCEPGSVQCIDDQTVRVCSDDGQTVSEQRCGPGASCTDGRCQQDPGCCEGGCGTDEFCSNCQCLPITPGGCSAQDEPCDSEGYSNGYWCADIGSSTGQLRCLGICDQTADDPNSTCPDDGNICAFGDDQGQGVCMTGCTIDQGCGVDGYGCLPVDGQQREGMCVPTNSDNEVGDQCDDDMFFDCEEGAYCINTGQGGRCVEGCRPFVHGSSDSDCSDGHCVALTDTFGMCQPNAGNAFEGDRCRRQHIGRACNEDAVGCYPSGGGQGPQCIRICRLDEDDDDCTGAQSCYQYDQQRDDLGVCVGQ